MMNGFGWGSFFGFVILVTIWSLVWKAFALWKAARRGDSIWFVVFLIVNTVGIVELLYLFVFSEPKGILKDTSNTVGEEKGEKEESNPQM